MAAAKGAATRPIARSLSLALLTSGSSSSTDSRSVRGFRGGSGVRIFRLQEGPAHPVADGLFVFARASCEA